MADTRFDFSRLSRRTFFMGSAGLLCVTRGMPSTPGCTLSPEQEEGPYYLDNSKVRQEITEGRPGVPLRLRIQIVDARRCEPIPEAAVDIWHCDALGVYSGFTSNGGGMPGPGGPRGPRGPRAGSTDSTRFLRGLQLSNGKGFAEFSTLYPGWYQGRAIHVHVKVRLGGKVGGERYEGGHVSHTGQVFLPEDVTGQIAKLEPYATRAAVHRTTQEEDQVFTAQQGSASLADLARLKNGSNLEGFTATVVMAVDPDAVPRTAGPRRRA